jgi:SWI/SNF-related matrix-associated actin-dependent regulator 1 of chromatin subfamily A
MKKDVLAQLPEKRHQIVILPQLPNSAEYGHELSNITEENYEDVISKLHANKIAFADYSKKRHEQGLAKVDHVLEHVKLVLEEVDKIILFAHHTDVVMALAEILVYYGCVYMTGKNSVSERQNAVDIFMQDPNCKIIIGSIETLGVGWTLTASSLVMFAEIDTVPGKMAQAADRVHRIGQRNSVLVQYLVQNGSLDARICKILIKKMKVVNAILNESVTGIQSGPAFDREDFDRLSEKHRSDTNNTCNHPHQSIKAHGARYICEMCKTVMR